MRPVTFKSFAFRPDASDRDYQEMALLYLLEAGCRLNMLWIKKHPETPLLYKSGVVYKEEDGTEDWKDIPTVIEDREGDCEDLNMYRVAELRVRRRIRCRPFIRWREKAGFRLYHVLTAYTDDGGNIIRIEDPSRRLGMGS